MTKLSRLVALLCVLGALGAGSASAANWQSGNTGAFTLTATTVADIDINAGAATVNCTTFSISGTFNVSPPAGTNPWLGYAVGVPAFTGCTTGGVATTVTCAALSLDTGVGPGAYAGPIIAPGQAGRTVSTIQAINCTIRVGAVNCSTIVGSTPAMYTNSSALARTDATLIFPGNPGQAITATKIGGGCAAIPNGAAYILNGAGAGMLLKYTIPGGGPPTQPWLLYG